MTDRASSVRPSDRAASLVIMQAAIGDYRQAVLDVLVERLGSRLRVYAGREYFEPSTTTRVELGDALRWLGNRYLLRRKLLWQHGAVRAARSGDVAIVEFNPRILSVWVILILRRLRRRRTLLWGHAWSRSGRHSRTELLRSLMRRLASGVIVYTAEQARELGEVMAPERIFTAPNAVYQARDMVPDRSGKPRDSFLYVGRLVASKKPDVLLEAFIAARDRLPAGTRLVIVGDGELGPRLRDRARTADAPVEFLGHVAELGALKAIYARAIAAVSPGFAGLNVTQGLGFGVPILISRDEWHSPEIAAVVDGWNARLYTPSTPESLAEELIRAAADADLWESRREAISEKCRSEYSAEAMADGLLEAAGMGR